MMLQVLVYYYDGREAKELIDIHNVKDFSVKLINGYYEEDDRIVVITPSHLPEHIKNKIVRIKRKAKLRRVSTGTI